MTIKSILNGSVVGTDQGNAVLASLRFNILNAIRTLQDRAANYSKGRQDLFAEAYVTSSGRNSSVVAASTDCQFNTNKYMPKLQTDTPITDATVYSCATKVYSYIKTSAILRKFVSQVTNELGNSSSQNNGCTYRFKYTDGTYADVNQTGSGTSYVAKTYTNPNPYKVVESIEMYMYSQYTTYTAYARNESIAVQSTVTGVIHHKIVPQQMRENTDSILGVCHVADWELGDSINIKAYSVAPQTIVEITATSLNENDFKVNDCYIKNVATGKWVLYIPSYYGYTQAQESARLLLTLFYGDADSVYEPRISMITGLSSVKISDSTYQGKKCYYMNQYLQHASSGGTGTSTYTATFSDTTNNANTTIFTKISDLTGNYTGTQVLQYPSGTSITYVDFYTPSTKSNQATAVLYNNFTTAGSKSSRLECLIFYSSGTISLGTADASLDYTLRNTYDFYATGSVPLTGNVSVSTYFTAANTGWLNIAATTTEKIEPPIIEYTELVGDITDIEIQLVPRSTNPTPGYPAIYGTGAYAE